MSEEFTSLSDTLKNLKGFKEDLKKKTKRFLAIVILIALFSSFCGFFAGALAGSYYYSEIKDALLKLNIHIPEHQNEQEEHRFSPSYVPQTSQEQAVIKAVEKVSPAVVSIIITKDVPIIEEYYTNPFEEFFGEDFGFRIPHYRQKGTEKKEVGGGSGFIISEDGMVLTNKHVVLDEDAEYTVFTNDGKKYPAKVLAKDPVQDLAILKIVSKEKKKFPVVVLGDSSDLKIGQSVIAIGNALGEFRNTVSVGVISGLGRSITAGGGGFVETIEDVIQTDAAINKGNSGGPLVDLKGEVIGVNTATVLGAQNISFAIPINRAKRDINQFKREGKITYAFLGIYYTLIDSELQRKYNLPVDYGAWVGRRSDGKPTDEAVFPGSAADKAGIERDDIILEFGGERVTQANSLTKIISKYNPGDEVEIKLMRGKETKTVKVVLGEREK
ncbi:trypsin-like peptidase domain-containing protein [bacterium]|nr:trypsin-like peptidase domain-containing protein [bacterium]